MTVAKSGKGVRRRRVRRDVTQGFPESSRVLNYESDIFVEPGVKPEKSAEPPTPLTPHLFVGDNLTDCGICHQFRSNQLMHTDWDYVPEVKADELEDAHPFKGTGEKCEQCDRAFSHLIHGMHAPETGLASMEERQVIVLQRIADAVEALVDLFQQCTTQIDDAERVVRVWTHNRDRA